jgi:hypothetical protein
MLASRSVVSRRLRALGDFLYTLKAGLRAAACGGRPRARGGAGVQVVGRVVVPAGCRQPRQAPQRRPGLPASTTKSNSRTWRGRGVCEHSTTLMWLSSRL